MNENEQNLNNNGLPRPGGGPWWKPGMQILSEVSTWIVVPIVLALVFGKMLDARYGTKPIIFLVFAGVGFLVTCFGMYKVIKNYMQKIQPPKSPLSGGQKSSSLDKGRTEEGLNEK